MIDITTDKFSEGGTTDEEEMYRGNSPLLATDFGYMTITHKLLRDDHNRPYYVNFITEYNADLSIRRHSQPFKLCDAGIEFVTSLLDLPNGEIGIGVTEMDDKPMMMVFDKANFLNAAFNACK